MAHAQLCARHVRTRRHPETHAGSFGPGSFVWFPEGMEMEHGATQDNDVTFLFIANKPLDIHYINADQPKPTG